METLFEKIFSIFSLEYLVSVVIASYLCIKGVDFINGKRRVPTWMKRLITFIVGGVLFIVFKKNTEISIECLITSFFSAIFIYDTAIKFLIKKFNIGYRK